jgi:hypothetical protein
MATQSVSSPPKRKTTSAKPHSIKTNRAEVVIESLKKSPHTLHMLSRKNLTSASQDDDVILDADDDNVPKLSGRVLVIDSDNNTTPPRHSRRPSSSSPAKTPTRHTNAPASVTLAKRAGHRCSSLSASNSKHLDYIEMPMAGTCTLIT